MINNMFIVVLEYISPGHSHYGGSLIICLKLIRKGRLNCLGIDRNADVWIVVSVCDLYVVSSTAYTR